MNQETPAAIRDLGLAVDSAWLRKGYDLDSFPDVSHTALSKARIHDRLTPQDILRWLAATRELPQQADLAGRFGQPPITLFASRRFHISALFWVDGTTSIHQHGFSGAFQVLAGGSLHATYSFRAAQSTGVLKVGELALMGMEVLQKGDVRAIRNGERFIHSLFHLERPSVTLVIRTWSDSTQDPQFTYFHPGIAIDMFLEDPWALRVQQVVKLLEETADPSGEVILGEMLASSDPRTGFLLLRAALGLQDRALFGRMIEKATALYGPFAVQFSACFEELRRVRLIASRRSRVRGEEHRFFLAVMMNAPTRSAALEAIASYCPASPPEDSVVRWVSELTRVTLNLQVAGLPWEANALGLPEADPSGIEALRLAVRTGDCPPSTFLRAVKRSPFLRPLFL